MGYNNNSKKNIMKNLVVSMLAIASISVLSSCSNESDVIDEVTGGNQDKVEIKVAAGVLKAETKAPVDGTDPVEVSILRKDGTDTWGSTPIKVNITANTNDLFSGSPQYYETDATKNAFFIGFYPGTASGTTVTFTDQDGKQDVLLSNELNAGNRTTPATSPTLTFKHKLSLIKFTFIKGASFPADDQVTSVTLKGADVPATMSLADGSFTWANKATAGISAFTSGTYNIVENNTTTINNEDALMIQPGEPITLDITTKNNGNFTVDNVKIGTTDGQVTEAGKQYNIKLTFSKKSVSATATIEGWGEAIDGSGTAE